MRDIRRSDYEGPDGERYGAFDPTRTCRVHPRRTSALLWALVVFALVVTAVGVIWAGTADAGVAWCPTEDSCVADYHDGAWHINEVTP